jgi:mono/diheme cytochrome c family protein
MKILTPNHPLILAGFVAGSSVLGALGLSTVAASNAAGSAPLPSTRPVSAQHGRQLFVQSCAHCHGDDARGSGEDGDGPDLFRLRIGNARIAAVIRAGIPDEMPSFARKHNAADISDLTAYLRTLR